MSALASPRTTAAVAALLALPLAIVLVGDTFGRQPDPVPMPASQAAALQPAPAPAAAPRPALSPSTPHAGELPATARYVVVIDAYLDVLAAGGLQTSAAEGSAFRLDEMAASATTPACAHAVRMVSSALRDPATPPQRQRARVLRARERIVAVC